MSTWKIGDVYPVTDATVGDCPAVYVRMQIPVPALCVRESGHEPPHLASDGDYVVEVWDDEVEVWE